MSKLSTINLVVEAILSDRREDDLDHTSHRKIDIIANEAAIYGKTFWIAENKGIDAAMDYFKGTHSSNEYQEFRTFAVGASDD